MCGRCGPVPAPPTAAERNLSLYRDRQAHTHLQKLLLSLWDTRLTDAERNAIVADAEEARARELAQA